MPAAMAAPWAIIYLEMNITRKYNILKAIQKGTPRLTFIQTNIAQGAAMAAPWARRRLRFALLLIGSETANIHVV